MTNIARSLELLRDGPATTRELSAELAIGLRHASADLSRLHKRGQVERRVFREKPITYLWHLLEQRS